MRKAPRDERQGDLFQSAAEVAVAAADDSRLDHAALIDWLAGGRGKRPVVLTPNLRLAQALETEVDQLHLKAQRSHWEAPDAFAFFAYLRRCHDEALYAPAGEGLPSLLAEPAALLLWEEAIRASRWRESLLSIPAAAALAAEAWTLAHAWRIAGALQREPGSEDAEAFAEWAQHYARRTKSDGLTDFARLPGVVAPLLAGGDIARPVALVVYAFELLTPQQSDFLDECRRGGIEVMRCDAPEVAGRVNRVLLETPRAELEHAARWARARLESAAPDSNPRIAVVVPDLAQRRHEVARVFARVLGTGQARVPLFNLSLGEPLSAYPLVDAALALIELASGSVAYERASRVLRSAFIDGAETEVAERARLDAALRRIAPASISLARLRVMVSQAGRGEGAPACVRLAKLLDRVIEASHEQQRAAPHEWARRYAQVLEAAGFPGERALDSTEFQTLAKWGEAMDALAALSAVASEWAAPEARARLQRLCADTVFQPRSGSAPVQVLGMLESVGLAFDHLWVSGLTEGAWPIPARPHPLVAPALQRRAGIPQASPDQAFHVDERITRGWRVAAPEVIFSSARTEGDRELLVSPLVADVAARSAGELGIAQYPTLRDALFKAGRMKGAITRTPDDVAPPVVGNAAQGGTGILVDQAACPFRAYAHFRLDARALEVPEPGLGPLERGTLLHSMMAKLWEALKDSATLKATDTKALDALIDAAAAHAISRVHEQRPGRLEGRFAELERERLATVAREWLEIEAARAPFEVRMREESIALSAGNLRIEGRIDRIDRLEGGGLAVIDYKSGAVAVGNWMGARPADAQLPLYALAAGEEEVRAVAFARLKTGDRRFAGVAKDADALPGVYPLARKYAASWSELFAMWRREVDQLGENFASGDARVDPKEMLSTCRWCDLKPLCRVHERLSALDEGDDEDAEDGE